MSINHYRYSDNNNIAEAGEMWSQVTMDSSSPHSNLDLNHMISTTEDSATMEPSNELSSQEEEGEIPKEPLFQKPLTPSDVGKLNRLVIPKQHAEKYFPLNGDSGEKGLLLSFEDEVGKCWRFRYSYWNSSQSYVLTKGWSRFVKEKKLDAGDVVLFLRHPVDGGRMFIGWRRKAGAQPSGGGGVGWRSDVQLHHPPQGGSMANYSNSQDYPHAASVAANQQSSTRVHSSSKRLRLFGVNLEYQPAESDQSDPSTPVGSPMSTSPAQVVHHQQQYYHQYYNYYPNSYYTVRAPDI